MKQALIIIDIQNDYFKGGKNELYEPEKAASNARLALDYFRKEKLPIYHIQHISNRNGAAFFLPDTAGAEIHESVKPKQGEKVLIKHTPNSFLDTGLEDELKGNNIDHITVCGMMSQMCIDTTVRAAKAFGFSVTLLHDACTAKDLKWEEAYIPASVVHGTIMASLQGIFASVMSTEEFFTDIRSSAANK